MTRSKLTVYLATVLSTAREMGTIAKSPIYLALGCDIHDYTILESFMVRAGLATVTSETLTLTPKGIELAKEVDSKLGIS